MQKGMGEYLKRKVRQVSKFHPEIKIVEVNTNIDHMHIDGINISENVGKQCGKADKNKYRKSNERTLSVFK